MFFLSSTRPGSVQSSDKATCPFIAVIGPAVIFINSSRTPLILLRGVNVVTHVLTAMKGKNDSDRPFFAGSLALSEQGSTNSNLVRHRVPCNIRSALILYTISQTEFESNDQFKVPRPLAHSPRGLRRRAPERDNVKTCMTFDVKVGIAVRHKSKLCKLPTSTSNYLLLVC